MSHVGNVSLVILILQHPSSMYFNVRLLLTLSQPYCFNSQLLLTQLLEKNLCCQPPTNAVPLTRERNP